MKRLFALVLTVVLLCGVMLSVPASAYGGGAKWVSAWSTSPVDASLSEIDALRVQLNEWMRSDACPADGVVSFPELADPADPAALQAAYTTDGIHITDAGAQRIANAIPLEWFD